METIQKRIKKYVLIIDILDREAQPRLDGESVDSYRPEVSFGTGCQAGVERHPFELSLEVLAEAALARLPEPRHLTEVDASGYGKITNPGLDEELLERLVNLLRGKGKSTT